MTHRIRLSKTIYLVPKLNFNLFFLKIVPSPPDKSVAEYLKIY
jgi:hypothetical protein